MKRSPSAFCCGFCLVMIKNKEFILESPKHLYSIYTISRSPKRVSAFGLPYANSKFCFAYSISPWLMSTAQEAIWRWRKILAAAKGLFIKLPLLHQGFSPGIPKLPTAWGDSVILGSRTGRTLLASFWSLSVRTVFFLATGMLHSR